MSGGGEGTADAGRSSVLAELGHALRDELAARTLYRLLARRVVRRDAELARVLDGFHADEEALVADVRGMLVALGADARASSVLRTLFARMLHAATWIGALPLALRLCHEAEERGAYRYGWCAHDLQTAGEHPQAERCASLAQTKRMHAQTLEAWMHR